MQGRNQMSPREWKSLKLEDVLTLVQYGTSLPSSEDGNVLVLGMKNLSDGSVTFNDCSKIKMKEQDVEKLKLINGDILLNRTNSSELVGKVGIFRDKSIIAVFASYLVRLRCNTEMVEPEFLNYWLNSSSIQRQLKKLATRAVSQANINPTIAKKKLPVLLPPLREQKAVVETLLTWDEAIEKTKRLIIAKKRVLGGIRQKILNGKIRLEGFNKPWKLVHLSKVLCEHKELSSGFEEVYSVSVHKGLINQIEHLGRSFAASNTDNYNLVKPGDVVYTKSPTGDFPYGIVKQSKLNYNVLVSPLYGVFTPSTFELGAILDTIFESKTTSQNYLRPLIQKGAKNTINITNPMFLSGALYLPLDYEEQKKIFGLINNVKNELSILKNLKEKYIQQKQGLMQKLLTGKWRVNFKEEK